jgi:nucleoside-diphosphate-sugar epimerase
VVALVYQAAGTRPRLRVTPAWQMRALGLVNRAVREVNEMRYEFDEPFIVDASRAETELGLRATPLADAVGQTVRWYREQATPSSATDQKGTAAAAPATAASIP